MDQRVKPGDDNLDRYDGFLRSSAVHPSSIRHPVRTVERKCRHLDLEILAALAHHLVAAGHDARGGPQRHAAGIFEALARPEHRLFPDHAFAADLVPVARGVDEYPT